MCSVKFVAKVSELERALKIDVCSAKLDVEPSALVRVCANDLVSEPTVLSAPLSDLKSDICSAKVEEGPIVAIIDFARPFVSKLETPNEPIGDLKNDDFTESPETKPKERLNALWRETRSTKLVARPIALIIDLANDVCSAKVETEATELDRDLKIEECSTRLDDGPSAVFRVLARLLT